MQSKNDESIYDYSIIRGKIREVFGNEQNFANAMGIAQNTLINKFNKDGFKQSEMDKACFLLGTGPGSIRLYFFTHKVGKSPTKLKRWLDVIKRLSKRNSRLYRITPKAD